MSRSKITSASIEDSTIAAADIASGAVEGAMATPLSHRNLIINGGFDVWQRGTSSTTYGYIADRFRMSVYSGTVTHSRVTSGLDNHYYAYRITNVSGTIEIEQRLEGTDIPNNADEMTISFWVRGSKAGSIRTGRIINGSTGTNNTGASLVNVTTGWTKVSVTTTNQPSADPSQYYRVFVADSLAGYFSSTADWLEITGVQLEVGSVATPFEHRSYGEELARCFRYYQRLGDNTQTAIGTAAFVSTAQFRTTYFLKTEMRTSPSFTSSSGSNHFRIYNGTNHYMTSLALDVSAPEVIALASGGGLTTGTAGQAGLLLMDANASSYLAFDAEL